MKRLNKNWHFNLLGIYNFNSYGSFQNLFQFIENNHNKIEGDIVEAGVFRGNSLLSIALFLKKLGSSKKVFGFDTFSGFPPVYHERDNFKEFDNLFNENLIDQEHLDAVKLNQSILKDLHNKNINGNTQNISSSGEFEETSLKIINKKIEYLELDNVILIQGDFSETMKKSQDIDKVMSAVIDCDLYNSYQDSLNFIWPKLSKGGFIHLDEYYSLKYPGERRATLEFISDKPDAFLNEKSLDGDFERWFITKK